MTWFVCVGPYCWGKATTTGAAVRGAKAAWPGSKEHKKTLPYNLYEVQEDAYVDEHGTVRSDHPIKKIRAVTFVGGQRVVKEKFDEVPEVREPGTPVQPA